MLKLSLLKTFCHLCWLLAMFFCSIYILTFFLIDFQPLHLLNDWVLALFLDNQHNKLTLFYMILSLSFSIIGSFLNSILNKQNPDKRKMI